MDNPIKPAACGCSTDMECNEHRYEALVHSDQRWHEVAGHPGINPADDALDLF